MLTSATQVDLSHRPLTCCIERYVINPTCAGAVIWKERCFRGISRSVINHLSFNYCR